MIAIEDIQIVHTVTAGEIQQDHRQDLLKIGSLLGDQRFFTREAEPERWSDGLAKRLFTVVYRTWAPGEHGRLVLDPQSGAFSSWEAYPWRRAPDGWKETPGSCPVVASGSAVADNARSCAADPAQLSVPPGPGWTVKCDRSCSSAERLTDCTTAWSPGGVNGGIGSFRSQSVPFKDPSIPEERFVDHGDFSRPLEWAGRIHRIVQGNGYSQSSPMPRMAAASSRTDARWTCRGKFLSIQDTPFPYQARASSGRPRACRFMAWKKHR